MLFGLRDAGFKDFEEEEPHLLFLCDVWWLYCIGGVGRYAMQETKLERIGSVDLAQKMKAKKRGRNDGTIAPSTASLFIK